MNPNFPLRTILLLLMVVGFVACNHKTGSKRQFQTNPITDSIDYYIDVYKKPGNQEHQFQRAYKLCNKLKDTLKLNYLTEIGNLIFYKDSTFFEKINSEKLELATSIGDTLNIGKTQYMYGYVYYYTYENLYKAYYHYSKCLKQFKSINNQYWVARTKYDMALIKQNIEDYTGSEKLIFEAIKSFNQLDEKPWLNLHLCYNALALNYKSLREFDDAVNHHNKALGYAKKIENNHDYLSSLHNNIGLVYSELEKYSKAIEHYEKGLNNQSLKKGYPKLYATLLDNLAYSKFKTHDNIGIYPIFREALNIRDSLNLYSKIATSKIHMAEFYAFNLDTLNAIKFAKEAEVIARNHNNTDRLRALKLLSILDKENDGKYLETHIRISDSIEAEERAVRNKFTRIEFQTDEYKEETEKLTLQNILISVIGGILVLVFALLYFMRRQRAKNKELLFEQEQQRANEEIYNLMLKQQANLEEGRTQERHRISEELHDGVLGKLFGTRVGMGFLSLTGDQDDVKEYKSYLDELQGIEKEIRDISHALKNNILKTDNSFITVIEQYISNQSKAHGFGFSLENDKNIVWANIDDKLKVTLYRIIQEAIQNMVKHAQANNLKVSFNKSIKFLHLNIQDDGKGFNTLKGKKGIGLKNMKTRILKHQGEFKIDSKEGQGTSISIVVRTK